MPPLKLDLIFESKGRGWRETYYRQFESIVLGQALKTVQSLAQKRAALCGKEVQIKAYSISDPLAPGRQGESVPFNPRYTGFDLTEGTGSVTHSAAVNVLFSDEVTRLHRRIWMRGVWDLAISNTDEQSGPDWGSWYSQFLIWREFVLAKQFGWLHQPQAAVAPCIYDYLLADQFPTFTFAEPFFDPASVNKFQSVRFSRFNGSHSTLNRELKVKVLTTSTCRAALPIAAGPMVSEGQCIRYGEPQFVTATNIGVGKVGRRAPGSPLLHTPGRARAAARS